HLSVQWLHDSSCWVDVREFHVLLEEASAAKGRNDRAGEAEALRSAAELYEDDLLPGIYDDWLTPFRDEYRRCACDALRRLAALTEETGVPQDAIVWAERLLALDSISEANYQLLIRLHANNNDRASALRAYHQCM